jgi:hypothetical protein|eukprot:COSAG01_NODE_4332_length_5128_cov_4.066017_3_plen_360_part_00
MAWHVAGKAGRHDASQPASQPQREQGGGSSGDHLCTHRGLLGLCFHLHVVLARLDAPAGTPRGPERALHLPQRARSPVVNVDAGFCELHQSRLDEVTVAGARLRECLLVRLRACRHLRLNHHYLPLRQHRDDGRRRGRRSGVTLPGHRRHRRVLRADRARHRMRPTRRVRTRRTTVAILRLKAVVVVVVKVIVAIAVVVFVITPTFSGRCRRRRLLPLELLLRRGLCPRSSFARLLCLARCQLCFRLGPCLRCRTRLRLRAAHGAIRRRHLRVHGLLLQGLPPARRSFGHLRLFPLEGFLSPGLGRRRAVQLCHFLLQPVVVTTAGRLDSLRRRGAVANVGDGQSDWLAHPPDARTVAR